MRRVTYECMSWCHQSSRTAGQLQLPPTPPNKLPPSSPQEVAILTNLVLLDLIPRPRLFILLVQKDGLEDVIFLGLGLVELVLEVGTVEAHFLSDQHVTHRSGWL